MLLQTFCILFAAICAFAQGPTTQQGVVFNCPAGDQGLQAFSTICPLRLDPPLGANELSGKLIDIRYDNAPDSYQTTGGSVNLVCRYSPGGAGAAESVCGYNGGGGASFTLSASGAGCPPTTANNGDAPRPSGAGRGNYYKKRQNAASLQMEQPSFVCPRQPAGLNYYLRTSQYSRRADGTNQITCICLFNGNVDIICDYAAMTGGLVNPAGASDRCPTTACPSPQYQAQMRKRALEIRQVKAAALRA